MNFLSVGLRPELSLYELIEILGYTESSIPTGCIPPYIFLVYPYILTLAAVLVPEASLYLMAATLLFQPKHTTLDNSDLTHSSKDSGWHIPYEGLSCQLLRAGLHFRVTNPIKFK